MDPDSAPRWRCDACGGDDDLYLVTFTASCSGQEGNAGIRCDRCREGLRTDVAVPISLVTPRLVLGLHRLRKLEANLSRLIAP